MKPLCFVLMPYGPKPASDGTIINFDAVYDEIIAPAIGDAQFEAVIAREELAGGIIHKPMFERLLLCDFAVADLTTANANVFYELGVRHALRPHSTTLMHAAEHRLPFDVEMLRSLPYRLGPGGVPAAPADDRAALAARLSGCRQAATDSPVFQLVQDLPVPDVKRLKTDVFRDRLSYSARRKEELAVARAGGRGAVYAVERSLGDLRDAETGVVVDLFLSYRAVKSWDDMIRLAGLMSPPLAATVMVREQLALALNRAGRGAEAERLLLDLIRDNGPSSETWGILGRVYKDRWDAARRAGQTALADGMLRKAINAYLQGFEADWRDAYPGINAVTLMEIHTPPDPRREALLPVVRYAVERRIAGGRPDYWDHATRLELAVLAGDKTGAENALADALACVREAWEPETTANNLSLIREARAVRGAVPPWTTTIEKALRAHA